MDKELRIGQKWAHIDSNNNYAIYEIIDIYEDGTIEDAIIEKSEGHNGVIGLIQKDTNIHNYLDEFEVNMQPLYKVSPLYRTLNG
jgi:hypothetical protein